MAANPIQDPNRLGAVVLCGGNSTRLGMDKTQLIFEGQTFLERVVERVGEVCAPIVLVGESELERHRLPDNLLLDRDRESGNGPLEGIRVGLKRLAPHVPYAFVTSCDVPMLRPDVIRFLFSQIGKYQAIVPRDGERTFGLTAIYQTQLHVQVGQRVEAGQLRVSDLADAFESIKPDVESMRAIDPNLDSMTNINSLKDYRELLARFGMECPEELAKRIPGFTPPAN